MSVAKLESKIIEVQELQERVPSAVVFREEYELSIFHFDAAKNARWM